MKNTILLFLALFYSSLSFSQEPTGNLVFTIGSSTVCQGTLIQLNLEFDTPPISSFYSWFSNGNMIFDIANEGNGGSGVGDEHSFVRLTLNEPGLTTISVQIDNKVFSQQISVYEASNAGNDTSFFLCDIEGSINLFDYLGGNPNLGGVWRYNNNFNEEITDGVFNTSTNEPGIYVYTVPGVGFCPESSSIVTVRSCPIEEDYDNDGVPNDVDLDDDNDGILDIDEDLACVSGNFKSSETRILFDEDFGEGGPISDENVSENLTYEIGIPNDFNDNDGEYNVATSTYLYNFGNQAAFYISTDENNFWDGDDNVDGRFLAINMKTSSFVNEVLYEVQDLVVTPGIIQRFSMKVVNLSEGIIPTFKLQIIAQSGAIVQEIDSNTADLQNIDIWNQYVIEFVPSAGIENIGFRIINTQSQSGNGNNIGIDNIFLSTVECNIDGDELPNYLDVDSDNDGVFDAIEAGLDPSLDANNDGVVDGGVDINGVPLAVSGGLEVLDENNNGIPDYLEGLSVLSINDNVKTESFGIYPNPASESITIDFSNSLDNSLKEVLIYDINGNVVKEEQIDQNIYQVDISNLSSGMYFISDKGNNSILNSRKIIIK